MSQKQMPGLLVASGGSDGIGGALIFGVLVGNNGIRQLLRGLAVLQIMFAVWVLL